MKKKNRVWVKMFQPRFARLVESGQKQQTIRPIPKRMPEVGDEISLREWTGKPYRSKQRVLRHGIIVNVGMVEIKRTASGKLVLEVLGEELSPIAADAFAEDDGFSCASQMARWFDQQHGLPFCGILIEWRSHVGH